MIFRILVTLTLLVIAVLFSGCPNMAVPIESTDNLTKPVTGKPIAKDNVSKENIKEAEKHYNEGLKAIDAKDYRLALKELNQAVKLNPNYAEAYSKIGGVYFYKKQYDKALNYTDKAIELKPNYAPAYNNLGSIYIIRKDYPKAIESYTKAISLDPSIAEPHSGLGLSYFNQGDSEKALREYITASTLKFASNNINKADNQFSIALIYYRKGDFVNAKTEVQKALAIDPTYKQAIKLLSLLQRKGY